MRLPLVVGFPDATIILAKDGRPDLIKHFSRLFNGLEAITVKRSARSDDLSATENREVYGAIDFTVEACPENSARSSRPPPEVDLPEEVAGGVEALGDEGVVDRDGVDVRYAPTAHEDLKRCFESLKGVAFFEGLPEHLYARLVVACRDELILECPQEQTEEVTLFHEGIMVSGMDEVLNPGLDADRPERVPIHVVVEIFQSWGER